MSEFKPTGKVDKTTQMRINTVKNQFNNFTENRALAVIVDLISAHIRTADKLVTLKRFIDREVAEITILDDIPEDNQVILEKMDHNTIINLIKHLHPAQQVEVFKQLQRGLGIKSIEEQIPETSSIPDFQDLVRTIAAANEEELPDALIKVEPRIVISLLRKADNLVMMEALKYLVTELFHPEEVVDLLNGLKVESDDHEYKYIISVEPKILVDEQKVNWAFCKWLSDPVMHGQSWATIPNKLLGREVYINLEGIGEQMETLAKKYKDNPMNLREMQLFNEKMTNHFELLKQCYDERK